MSSSSGTKTVTRSNKQSKRQLRTQEADVQSEKIVKSEVSGKRFHDKSELEILFEGSKILWKLRINMDSIESNRIYVSVPLLESKLDKNLMQARIDAKRESLIRHKKHFSLEEISHEVKINLMVDFLLSRLDEPKNGEDVFTIILVPHGSDSDDFDIVCEKPADLDPYTPHFNHKLSTAEKYEFQLKLHDLHEDAIMVHETNGLAEMVLEADGDAVASFLTKIQVQKAAAERRAKVWHALQHFAKYCRTLVARRMVEKFRIRLARMANPNYVEDAPIRRSHHVMRAMLQAQMERHKELTSSSPNNAVGSAVRNNARGLSIMTDSITPTKRAHSRGGGSSRRATSRRESMKDSQLRMNSFVINEHPLMMVKSGAS